MAQGLKHHPLDGSYPFTYGPDFFAVARDGGSWRLFARDGRWPNAAPEEALVVWPPGVPDPLGGSRTDGEREVRLGLDPSDREIRVPGHNFALLEWTDGTAHVYGGRATSGATGVQHFSAPSVRALADGGAARGAVVVRGTHGGCLEGRAAVLVCEWDGKLSAAVAPGAAASRSTGA